MIEDKFGFGDRMKLSLSILFLKYGNLLILSVKFNQTQLPLKVNMKNRFFFIGLQNRLFVLT